MQSDLYTKVMLTVIAVSLGAIATRGGLNDRAYAQIGSECGSSKHRPCYIATGTWPLDMQITR